jgi:hypothetical protein
MTRGAIAAVLSALAGGLGECFRWAGWLRHLPAWSAWLLGLPGILLLVAGARWRRLLALGGGAAVGFVAGRGVGRWIGHTGATAPILGALLLGGASFVWPPLFTGSAGLLVGRRVGMALALPEQGGLLPILGMIAGAGLGLAAVRLTVATAASAVGAALLVAALAVGSGRVAALRPLADHPVLAAAAVGVLTVAGAAYQLGASRRRSEDPWEEEEFTPED